jgi:hypothetical protein
MIHDDRDRYGKRHRGESEYDVGEPEPGTVGDSQGTDKEARIIDDEGVVEKMEFFA